MPSRSFTSSSRALPWAGLIAAVMIVVVEGFVHARREMLLQDPVIVAKSRHMRSAEGEADVLLFGDSRYFNLRPGVVERALGPGIQAVNYSWPMMGMDGYRAMYTAYRASHPPPRAILVNYMPSMVSLPLRELRTEETEVFRVRAYTAVPGLALGGMLLGEGRWTFLGDWLLYQITPPTARHRTALREGFEGLALEGAWPRRQQFVERWQREYEAEGAHTIFLEDTLTREEFEAYLTFFSYEPHDEEEVAGRFSAFVEQAGEEGVTVAVFNPPIPRLLADHYRSLGILEVYNRRVEALRVRHPNLLFIEPLIVEYPDELFSDAAHLNGEGTMDFLGEMESRLRVWRGRLMD